MSCPLGHQCCETFCTIRHHCVDEAARRAKEAMEEHAHHHHHPHPRHPAEIHRPISAARNTGVIRIDCFMNELGEWKVVAPNNNYRVVSHIDNIADTIRLVVADYGDFCRALVATKPPQPVEDPGMGIRT